MINTWKYDFEYIDVYKYRIDNMLSLLNLNNINSIMDLGCGKQTLKNKLPDTIKYIGVDLHQHIDGTIVKDFNNNEFHNENVDIIFCSGIFEYIYDMETFAKNISNNTNIVVGSYTFVDDVPERLDRWVNSYTIKDFVLLWYKLGYKVIFMSENIMLNDYIYKEKEYDRIFILANKNFNSSQINYSRINEITLKGYILEYNNNINNINLKIDGLINTIAWWIPVKKWRDNFKKLFQ